MTAIRAAAESHTGYIRSNNEDLAVVSGDLVAVADGMGGHLGGEVAARTAIEELVQAFQRDRTAPGLVTAVRKANRSIWRRSRIDRKLHGMGTTLTAIALVPAVGRDGQEETHLALVNIGDSRAYRLDPGKDGAAPSIARLTEDHSVAEEMVRQGELSPAEAAVHPHRHVLTRVLGMDSEVECDMWDIVPVVGSRFLLCSDGLTNEVSDEAIAEALSKNDDPTEAARELVGLALGHGGIDNVTVVVIDVVGDDVDLSQGVEMVPPRPPRPGVPGGDEGRHDITEALPVVGRAGRRRARRAGGDHLAGAGGEAEEAESEAPGAEADEGARPAGAAGLGAAAAVGGAAAAVAAAGAADPTAAAGAADSSVATGSTAEVEALQLAHSGPSTEATAQTLATESAGADAAASSPSLDGETGEVTGHVPRRAGRSMSVRGSAPTAPPHRSAATLDDQYEELPGGAGSGGAAGLRSGTVLVPTRRLSKQYRDRIVTFRVFLFLVLLVGLAAGVIGVVIWFQKSSYYVGLHGDRVSIYQGRPGGLLWFKPLLLETSAVTTKNLLPNSLAEVRRGIQEASYPAARQEITALTKLSDELGMGPDTTTTTLLTPGTAGTTTTTFAPAPPTTAATATTATTQVATTTTAPQTTTSSPAPPTTAGVTTTLPNHRVGQRGGGR